MITKIAHLGIAVKDLEAAKSFYEDILGLECTGEEVVESQKVKTAFFPAGDVSIELLESTDPEGPIAKAIEKRGEGVHHVAYEVADIEAALAAMKAKGVRLIDEQPRQGAHGAKIAFIHPKASLGVLVELCEYPR